MLFKLVVNAAGEAAECRFSGFLGICPSGIEPQPLTAVPKIHKRPKDWEQQRAGSLRTETPGISFVDPENHVCFRNATDISFICTKSVYF